MVSRAAGAGIQLSHYGYSVCPWTFPAAKTYAIRGAPSPDRATVPGSPGRPGRGGEAPDRDPRSSLLLPFVGGAAPWRGTTAARGVREATCRGSSGPGPLHSSAPPTLVQQTFGLPCRRLP